MQRRILVFLIALGPAFAPAVRAQHDAGPDTAKAREAIRALEQEWLETSDSVTLDRILADDFLHVVGPGQVINKSEHIAWNVQHPHPSSRHARFGALVIRVYGNAAVATGTVIVTNDVAHTTSHNSFTDVFVYRHGRWRAVSAEETPSATAPSSSASPSAPTS